MSELAVRTLPDENARKLARALKKRAPDLQCRVCGHSDFALLERPERAVMRNLPTVVKLFTSVMGSVLSHMSEPLLRSSASTADLKSNCTRSGMEVQPD